MRRIRRIGVLAAIGLAGVVALAGCAADGAGDMGSAGAPAGQEGAGGPGAAGIEGEAGAAPGDGQDDGGVGGELIDPRSIIYTGEVAVRVEDVVAAADRASAVATRYGGFVGGDNRQVGEEYARATLTLRIPSENFAAALDALGELGEETSRNIHTEDVTAEVVDLEVRIATARASVERTRELLEEAESIADIVAVEEELTARETRLAQWEARQRTLEDLTTLSTITVELYELETEPDTGPDAEEEQTGFLAGLRAGWDAFTASVRVVVTVLGALLPFLVTLGVPVGALIWWIRRRRRTAPDAPATTPQEGTPAGV